MKIAVLIKQVPGSDSAFRPSENELWIDETQVQYEMNESDAYALEEALLIKENQGAGEVVVVCMGPSARAPRVIREALAKGADRAIHIVEESPFETDPYQIANILTECVKSESFDLILSGLQSMDLGMGQTGVLLGSMLGMPTATLVMATEINENKIRVKRELESGWFQWVTVPLPACLSIQSGINTPRYPSLKGIMGAKKKEIRTINKTDIELNERLQRVNRIYSLQTDKKTEFIEGDPDDQVARLMDVLRSEVKVVGA
ncbi:MAG: electron transfer flavoprotein subunit beta/FixA family protein [Candidatus Neomarinimicrobiota bacterium]|jgi:electron transfer flavoprotein beta subunit|nr:electron transfer flavoprotein subunit beta/FixA family protein [Candidatus Neomarinimicrobiota bacterium]|tara:strand:- start:427 stop:1206 length:780 start_codon:yes stop_codon:yes gene_type:complete